MNILFEFSQVAARFANRIALEYNGQSITYQALQQRIAHLQQQMATRWQAGKMIVTLLPTQPGLVTSALAIWGAGRIFVPLDPGLPDQRLRTLLADLPVGLILTEASQQSRLSRIVAPDACPPVWCLDQADEQVDADAELLLQEHDLAYLYFTSGSTGTPKGVLGRTDSLLQFIRWEGQALHMTADDRVSLLTAQMFDPFLRDLLLPLLHGATLCLPPSRDLVYSPMALLDWFQQQRISVTHLIPSLFQVLIEQQQAAEALQALRVAALAGEMLKGSLVDTFYALGLPHATLINLYGPTETTLAKCWHRVNEADRHRTVVPVGFPIDAASVHVVDDAGQPVNGDQVGEVLIATPYMSAGYLNAAADDHARFFMGDGALAGLRLYRTGDLGRQLADGSLELIGRSDFQIKIDGQRIEPGEIESLLERHQSIRLAIVQPIKGPAGQTLLAAYLKRQPTAEPLTRQTWQTFLAHYLPAAAIPAHFQYIENFPRLPNGKIDRKALTLVGQPWLDTTPIQAPETFQQQQLAAIWQTLLQIEPLGLEADFFALGGSSLVAIRMLAQVGQLCGRTMPFGAFFQQPTLAALDHYLNEQPAGAESNWPSQGRSVGLATLDQQRLFLHQHLQPDSTVYNMAYVAHWQGPLDVPALRQTLQALQTRHPALRTAFTLVGEAVAARLMTPIVAPLHCSDAEDEEGAMAQLHRLAHQPFDLGSGQLWRVGVVSVGTAQHWLGLSIHHIAADAWSVDLLWQDLQTLYGRQLEGQAQAATAPATTVLDAAHWQQTQLAGAAVQQAREYWLEQLAGSLPITQLPYDREAGHIHSQRGARLSCILPASLHQPVHALAQAHQATPYMVLMAAFAAFLQRYTQQQDILIGTPVANRPHAAMADMVGFFVNLLVMRHRVVPGQTLQDLLPQVRQTVLDGLTHQALPFDMLVEALNPPRHHGVSPLFQVLFVYQGHQAGASRLGPVTLSAPGQLDLGVAKYDLTLEMWEQAGQLHAVWEYTSERFNADTIARMAANFEHYLTTMLAQPEQDLARLPLLSTHEARLLAAWNDTDTPFSDDCGIHHLIERQAARTPDAIAVIDGDTTINYRLLDQQANQLAHQLVGLGVRPGVTVGISIPRSAALVVGFLAILKAGGVYVPIDPDYPLARRRFMMEDANLALMVTLSSLQDVYADAQVPMLLVDSAADAIASQPRTAPTVQVGPQDLAYIIYTSGSTGRPKGVLIRHQGVCNLAEAEIELLQMGPGSRVLQFASFSFDTSIWEIVMTLCAGSALVMAPALSLLPGPDLLAQLKRHRVSHVTLPASALAALPDDPLPDLQVLIVAGEACGLDLLRKWGVGRCFVNSYGPTEATVSATNAILAQDAERIHIGRPLHNTQIHLLDEQGQPVPVGVAGELYIGGIGLAVGYHQRPELTAERFVVNPFDPSGQSRLYRTGDLARWLPDGQIDYLGRIDQQVKLRGFRVELGEVEAALRSHPAVVDAVAMVRHDYLDGAAIVAYVLVNAADQVDPAALMAQAQASLPGFMLPSVIVPMQAFPRLPNNKVDRKAFPSPHQPAGPATMTDDAPQGEAEQTLVTLWCRLLRRTAVSRHASFFDLGGHSLLAAKLVALLASEYQLGLSVRDVFEAKTIAALALRMARVGTTDDTLPATVGLAPLSHAQRRMWFIEQLNPGQAAYHITTITYLQGGVHLGMLCKSLDRLFSRHTVLNTRLTLQAGEVYQQIHAEPARYQIETLGGLSDADWQQAVSALASQDAAQPFTLLDQPLYRLRVLTASPTQCALVWTVHHLLLDEASLAVLDEDLLNIYTTLQAGQEVDWATQPIAYPRFASWDRDPARAAERASQLQYWQQTFASLPPVLTLPTDVAHEAPLTHQASKVCLALSPDLTTGIRQLAQQAGTTPFNVVWLAYQLLLHRYSGETDIAVGVPVSVRPMPALMHSVGLFLNTVILRGQIRPQASVLDQLADCRQRCEAALANQAVPFEQVVDVIDPARERGGEGVFQVMLAYTAYRPPIEHASLALRRTGVDSSDAKFDLTLFIDEQADHFNAKFEYQAARFAATTIARFARHFERLLQAMVAQPGAAVGSLPMLSADERQQLLIDWNQTDCPIPDWCVHQAFEAQVKQRPDAVACVYGNQRLSYRELNQRANRLARWLRANGAGRGQLVALFMHRSDQLVVAILAILKAGAAYLPIDAAYPSQRVAYMLDDSQAAIVLTEDSLLDSLPTLDGRVWPLDSLWTQLADEADNNLDLPVSQQDLAYVIYTSGSTGQPKGVMMAHRGLTNYLSHAQACYDRPATTGNPMHSSIAFDATITSLYLPLLTGKTLWVIPEDDELIALSGCWQREPALTLAKITPAHLELLGKTLPADAADHTQVLVIGGEALHGNALRYWREHGPAVRIINEYGPTEATVGCCIFDIAAGDCPSQGAVPIGRPIRNTHLYVLDEALQPVPIGAVGELYIGGAGLAQGYLNRPDLTEARFIRHPFSDDPAARLYKTGDLVRYLADGNLLYLGRKDHQVKLRGYRIELGEIDAALSNHPLVEAAATLIQSRQGRTHLVAYVVMADGMADTRTLRSHLSEQLPAWMMPSDLIALPAMPLTTNGKIDRDALARIEPVARPVTQTAATSGIEQQLVGIWENVLQTQPVGIHDNFFELGGDSILSLQIVFQARQLGLKLAPRMVFDYQTIAELASVLEPVIEHPVATPAGQGALPLTPIQHWFFAHNQANPHHFNQSFVFEIDPTVDLGALEAAFDGVLTHHECLRSRYRQQDGVWQAEIGVNVPPFKLQRCQMPLHDRQSGYLQTTLAQCQRELDIGRGALISALYLHDEQQALLLVVIHHLVVDGVSWQILLTDLCTAYAAHRDRRPLQLPARTASFQDWARFLAAQPDQPGWPDTSRYWRQCLSAKALTLPLDQIDASRRPPVASCRQLFWSLPEADTAVLAQAAAAYHANTADLLLAALAMTLQDWLGEGTLRIDLEGHGRDAWADAPDVSRTVGWFTSLFPVWVAARADWSCHDWLCQVKEASRRHPHQGASFGLVAWGSDEPLVSRGGEVCFNHLGRLEQGFHQAPLRGLATVNAGSRQAPDNLRAYLLEVDSYIHDGELSVAWTYSDGCHRATTVQGLITRFGQQLARLVAHCQSIDQPVLTPADLPLAGLDQPALDQLQAQVPAVIDAYPLTAMQAGMAYHSLQQPQAALYIEQLVFELTEPTPLADLQAAWQQLTQRHAQLRSRLWLHGSDAPLQLILQEASPAWQHLDLQQAADAEQQWQSWLQTDRGTPFDLHHAPLYRLATCQLPGQRQLWVLTHHHAILDGWSVQLLLDELSLLLREAALPGQPRPFRDHVAASLAQAPAALQYWQQQLAGLTELTPLPAAFNQPTETGQGRADFVLSSAQAAQLNQFARHHRLTLSTLMQGAWALLLSRYTGQQDCLFGVTVSGRAQAWRGVERMVGLFIGTVPARVAVDERQLVVTWLQAIQHRQLQDEQHASVSLADIKQQTALAGPGQLFESLLVFENYPGSQAEAESRLRFVEVSERTNFPLTLVISPSNGLHGHLHYDRQYYSASMAAQLLRHFQQLLCSLVEAEQGTLREVAMMPATEVQSLLQTWVAPDTALPADSALHLFEQQVAATPDAIALETAGEQLSYHDLQQAACQMAATLCQLGVQRGQLVAVCLPRSVALVTAMLASWYAGAGYLPIDISYPSERIAYLLDDSQAAVLITHSACLPRLPDTRLPCLQVDQPSPQGIAKVGALPSPGDLAYVIYTSGSTGLPKGVMIEQRGLVNYLNYARRAYRVSADSRALLHSSISFDATITSLWVPLVAGGRVVVVPDEADAQALAQAVGAAGQQQLLKITPVHLEWLGQTLQSGQAAHVAAMVVGGEALKGSAVAAWQDQAPAIRIFNEYGPTETVVGCCVYEFGAGERHAGNVPIGQPIDNTRLYLLDAEQRPVPFGATGELYIGGAGVARGYWNRPALTAERFIDDPFHANGRLYRTGDLVRALPNGQLDYVGRRDHQIKLRGYRIELGEIEAQLASLPAVRQAAVRLWAEDDGYLAAYLVAQDPVPPTIASLRAQLAQRLPAYMVPSHLTWLPALPETPNGKVDYPALPRPTNVSACRQAPSTETERQLAAIWESVLGIDEIGVDAHFLELGGHSLKALRLLSRIGQVWPVAITLQDLFAHPTIAGLAACIDMRRQSAPRAAPAPISRMARVARGTVEEVNS